MMAYVAIPRIGIGALIVDGSVAMQPLKLTVPSVHQTLASWEARQ